MSEINNKKINSPEGEVNEKELQELTDAETPDGGHPTVPITIAISATACPSTKCTSKC
ncbi:hypothetical protein SAMN05216390_12719 [Lachnospiraceae bacterium KH1T2]|nr:hypothetical protein SAMN05216390_12719 [Lachnospiraceae bacterium KH1T2]